MTAIGRKRAGSAASIRSGLSRTVSPRTSADGRLALPGGKEEVRKTEVGIFYLRLTCEQDVILWREKQRVSLRAFIRSLLHNPQVANTKAMQDFLSGDPTTPTDDDVDDIIRRKQIDEKRIEEQKKFYEIARKRAADLDEYMER